MNDFLSGLSSAHLPLWLVALSAALLASSLRVWRDRTLKQRPGRRRPPLWDAVPDVLLGTLAGLCLALLGATTLSTEPSWLLATLGGAAGPRLLEHLSPLTSRSAEPDEDEKR
ncbi:hypothetical protein [Deinococcus sp.]|uniref:hypothetical protein n=1 Tax=Deinococcus sp. TaxID=47478 RepID=UPI003CC5C005